MVWLRAGITTLALLAALAAAPALADPTFSAGPERISTPLPAVPRDWETVPGTYARVSGRPQHTTLMRDLGNHAAEALPRLARELEVPIGDTVHVYLVDSEKDFLELQPGAPPLWADATAYPSSGAIFLRTPGVRGPSVTPLETVLEHELIHILIGRAFAPADPPAWLQEGIARVYAGEFGPEDARIIAGREGNLLFLGELGHSFPRDPGRARLAYAQSADFVSWLRHTHGPRTVPTLVRALAREQDLEAAVRAATGESLAELEGPWLDRLRGGPPGWLKLFDGTDVFFGLGAVALVGAGIQRRRQFKQRMIEREAEERAEDEYRAARAGAAMP